MTPLQWGILASVLSLAVVVAAAAVLLQDVLNAIIAFATFSFGVAITWILFAAPDVALTEAAVGAGITTTLLLVTIARTVRQSGDRLLEKVDPRAAITAILFAGLLATTVDDLPAVGSPQSPIATSSVTSYYIENAYPETGVENAVTAVLAAYRGFDTLGEATVVIAAGLAVLVVLQQESYA
ncbi:DUF4040 domain-containing protein [Haloquadratum walsbyi]|jgi:Multisubunit Na+/H+ antiporter, MnhB subunit|uniref:Multisubunit Na+/H+ antiporter, MnhB subunit n=1 Tax=Haloquadratum walsbyi J07HQW2 TaxID=1238425 RepID=U1NHP1_9EURY|nr:DUF4040 domain-containing protein [Haloquadratum walsbyi]ERG96705.1 MAG: multisubunit Na+/H+ antiporter, MnhB subunit [Haloquadratum walsbyi J07HQW2]